jgi:flagellar protein FlaG
MVNDIGMIKGPLAPVAQGGPVAPADKAAGSDARPRATAQPPPSVAKDAEQGEDLQHVVADLNKLVRDLHRELQFTVDRESGETVIKVIDKETDEVIRQIPSDEIMQLRRRLEEASGVIFKDSA